MEKLFLKISKKSQENTCARFPFFDKLQAYNFIKKRLAQVLSCEFCGIFNNTYSYRRPLVAASEIILNSLTISISII